jgi:hypothetical protein
LELLEERKDNLILLGEGRVWLVENNSYNLLKYKFFRGKKIRFISKKDDVTISLHETEVDGIFECTLNGLSVTLQNSEIDVASAIFDAQEKASLDAISFLWRLTHVQNFLALKAIQSYARAVELTRDGELYLPRSVELEILDWVERPDGARVAKIILHSSKESRADRIFSHETSHDGRTRAITNDLAVVLLGRDETGQHWMHVVPPEYRNASIDSCEMWLAGGEEGKDELIDVLVS